MAEEWFETWFDSPYYHILYKNRNEEEAKLLIDNLAAKYRFNANQLFCDMACGKGRHSKYLNSKGFKVVGLDLSPKNIEIAKKSTNDRLKFVIHDMRDLYQTNHFDIILNLFTSFGYFNENAENQKSIGAFGESLKQDGLVIIDYMNSRKAIEGFQNEYDKTVNEVVFKIHKKIELGFIIKHISFTDGGRTFEFIEKVKLLFLEDFKKFFTNTNLELIDIYGDYNLNAYHELLSDRMIMVCKKL